MKLFNKKKVFLSLLFGGISIFVIITIKKEHISKNISSIPANSDTVQIISPRISTIIPILTYHYVEPIRDVKDTIRTSLTTIPSIFENQLETMKNAQYTFLFASDLADIMDSKKDMPINPVVLTFDDGYRDFYTDAFPLLKKYGIKSTTYIVPGLLEKQNYMTYDQVAETLQSRLVEIGSHTMTHRSLAHAPLSIAREEVFQSKYTLQMAFHVIVQTFAYPYGSYDTQSEILAKEAGYRLAMTTKKGDTHTRDLQYEIRRLRPGRRIGRELIQFLSTPQ